MIIVMEENAAEEQIVHVVDRLVNLGFDIHRSTGSRYTILGAVGSRIADVRELELLEGVNKVVRVSSPYKLAARAFKPEGTQIKLKDVVIGGEQVVTIAGPSVVESREQIETIAAALAKQGVRVLRGSAFRSSNDPYGFQGKACMDYGVQSIPHKLLVKDGKIIGAEMSLYDLEKMIQKELGVQD